MPGEGGEEFRATSKKLLNELHGFPVGKKVIEEFLTSNHRVAFIDFMASELSLEYVDEGNLGGAGLRY
jgi:hypothetical protein